MGKMHVQNFGVPFGWLGNFSFRLFLGAGKSLLSN